MACHYPITIRDKLHKPLLVPCGKCIACIERKRAEWSFRLLWESKNAIKQTFLTLTYDEQEKPKNTESSKRELQKYFKRVRSAEGSLKYYAVGEFGSLKGRIHHHAIVFNCDNSILLEKWSRPDGTNSKAIGRVSTDTVTPASIHYVTGYITEKYGKIDEKTGKSIPEEVIDKITGEVRNFGIGDLRPYALMSKGLGKIYLKSNERLHKSRFKSTTTNDGGREVIIPRYIRNRLFPVDAIGIELGLVPNNAAQLNSLKLYLLDKYGEVDFKEEFTKRQFKKIQVQTKLSNKKL
ncbi:MAG: replication initiator protein [Arizlama microvirus]|nr:MAG: replication initiator protein [Arizlama microvirus]